MNFKFPTFFALVSALLFSFSALACEVKSLTLNSTDPATGKEFELKVDSYVPKVESSKQVIILPPIGGTTLLEGRYAKKVCKKGVNAYVFVNWTDDMEESIEDLAVHNRGTIRGLHAVEIFLQEFPRPSSILGTSLGGLYAGIAVGKFDLIEKAAIIASGTNLAEILATSNLDPLVQLKKKRFEMYQFNSDQEYALAIKQHLSREALDFKESLSSKKLLFFKTNSDKVIRPKFQNELIDLFPKENVTVYQTRFGHASGIVYTSVRRSGLIVNFLAN